MAIDATANNVVEIILQANDEMTSTLVAAKESLVTIGNTALEVSGRFKTMSVATATSVGLMVSKLSELNNVVNLVQKAFDNPVGRQLIDDLQQVADEAVNEAQSLSSIFSAVTKGTTPLLEGLVIGEPKTVESKARGFADRLSSNLISQLKQGDKISGILTQQLEPFFEYASSNFGEVGKKGADAIRGFVSSAGGVSKIDSFVSEGLSKGLALGFDAYLSTQLPAELGFLKGGIQEAVKAGFVPPDVQDLLTGDFFGGLEQLVANRLGDGFVQAFQKIDAASIGAEGTFQKAGALAGQYFSSGFKISGFVQDAFIDALPKEGPIGAIAQNLARLFSDKLSAGFQVLDAPFRAVLGKVFSDGGDGLFGEIKTQFLTVLGELNTLSDGLIGDIGVQIGGRLGTSFAKGFASTTLSQITPVIDRIDSLILNSISFVEGIPSKLGGVAGGVSNVFAGLAGLGEPLEVFTELQNLTGGFTNGIAKLSEQITFFASGFQALQQFVQNGPFELLIGQNIRLREQLLATQSTLAATNKIVRDGAQIADPTQAIQALDAPVKNAIDELRKGSLELVNVTSNQLIDSFQIIAGQAGNIGFSLTEAKDLTLSFGAALGTLGVPLDQARQEITSILQAQVSSDSIVGKSLGLQNAQLENWKSQGTLVQNLSKRLEAFRAGNALAAQTIGGVTSNIQELFDELGRQAGEQLLEPIVAQLNRLYKYLNDNKEVLLQGLTGLVSSLLQIGEGAVAIFEKIFTTTQGIAGQIPDYLFTSLANAVTSAADAIGKALDILQPAINVFAALATQALALGGPFLNLFIQFKALQVGVQSLGKGFSILTQILPGVGELLFFLTGRSNSLVNTFASLTGTIGQGGAAFLLLGKNLNSIPGAAGAVAAKLGPFGPLIAGLIPTAAGLGIQLVGLSKAFPPLQGVLRGLAAQTPGVISQLAGLAGSSQILGGALAPLAPSLQQAARSLSTYTGSMDLAGLVNQKFSEVAKQAGIAVRQQVISFGLLAGGVFAAFLAFDQIILKNKNLQLGVQRLGDSIKKLIDQFAKATGLDRFASALGTIAGVLADSLSNPIVVAIAGVTAFGIALKVGLIPNINNLAKSLTGIKFDIFSKIPTEGLTNFASKVGESFNVVGGFKQKAEDLKKQLVESAAGFKDAIAERNKRIAEIDQQLPLTDPGKARATGRKPVGDANALQAERSALVQEVAEITDARKRQGAELASLQKQATNAPKLTEAIASKAGGSLSQLKGLASQLSGDALVKLGAATEKIGFDNLGKRATAAGTQLAEFGKQAIESGNAQGGLIKAAQSGGASLSTFGSGIVAAGKGIATFAATTLAAAGPILALTIGVAAITTAIAEYGQRLELVTKQAKDFVAANEESDKKIKDLATQRVAEKDPVAAAKEFDAEGTRKKRLDALKEQENVFQKFARSVGDNRSIDLVNEQKLELQTQGATNALDEVAKRVKLFKDQQKESGDLIGQVAALQKQQSEARVKGDTAEADRLGELIKRRQEEVDARKAGLETAITAASKIEVNTASQAKRQAELVNQLKDLRKEYENLANIKIEAQAVPRLGTAFEQLAAKARAAEEAISKGTGNTEVFKEKAKDLVDVTQKQLELGQITASEARRRLDQVASNANVEVDTQLAAQEAITKSFQTENDRRDEIVKGKQAEIEAQVAKGEITELEGQKRITNAKIDQLNQEVEAVREAKAAELRLEQLSTDNTLKEIDRRLAEAKLKLAAAQGDQGAVNQLADQTLNDLNPQRDTVQTQIKASEATIAELRAQLNNAGTDEEKKAIQGQLDKAGEKVVGLKQDLSDIEGRIQKVTELKEAPVKADPEAAKAAQKEIETIGKQREDAQKASNERVATLNNKFRTKESQNQAEIAKTRSEQQIRELEDTNSKAVDASKAAETEKLTEIQNLENAGTITKEEAENRRLEVTRDRISAELAAEEAKLSALEKAGKGQESVTRQTRQKILDLKKSQVELEAKEDDAKIKKFEKTQQKAVDVAKAAETQRLIQIEQLRQRGGISKEDADAQVANAGAARIQAELAAEKNKLAQLQAAGKGQEDAIRQSRLKILDLTKQSLDQEERIYQAGLAKIDKTVRKRTDTGRIAEAEAAVETQKLVNKGAISQEDADERTARSAKARIDTELAAEKYKLAQLQKNAKRNEDAIRESRLKVLELTKSSLDQEQKLYEQNIARIQKKLQDQQTVISNQLERQNQSLQRQAELYDILGKALEQRTRLLNASKDLSSASTDYLTQEIDILAKGERSQRKQAQLAEAAAAIKLQAVREQIQLEQQVFEIQQQQNRLALERREIENEIAVNKKKAEVGKGAIDVQIAGEQLKRGKITRAEFDSKVIEQQGRQLELGGLLKERGLIQREKQLQPLLEKAERDKQELNQRKQIRSAETELAAAAPRESQRRKRFKALGEQFAQESGLGSRSDAIQAFRDTAKAEVDRTFGGKGGADTPGGNEFIPEQLRKSNDTINKLLDEADKTKGLSEVKIGQGDKVKETADTIGKLSDELSKFQSADLPGGIAPPFPQPELSPGQQPQLPFAQAPQLPPTEMKQLQLPPEGLKLPELATLVELVQKIADKVESGAAASAGSDGATVEPLPTLPNPVEAPTGGEPRLAGNRRVGGNAISFSPQITVTVQSKGGAAGDAKATKDAILKELDDVTKRAEQLVNSTFG